MATYYADGATLYNANRISPPSQTNITTTEHYGRVRALIDWFTPPAAGIALTDDVIMGRSPIPAGSRILGGHWAAGPIGSVAATFEAALDVVGNVGTATPAISLYANSDDSYLVEGNNCGVLIPLDGTDFVPVQDPIASDFVAWINPATNTWTSGGTFFLAIFYVLD